MIRPGMSMRFTRVLGAAALLSLAVTPFARATGFGVNAHIPSDSLSDRIQTAGIEWVRADVLWSLIEPERDVYDWSVYDALVDRLESRGLRIYAGLGSTPGWATSGSETNGVPDDSDEWREICYLAARRYAGRIDAWGLWNEPNLGRFWQGTRQQYIDIILRPGAEAISLGDPSALVCAPDLAHLSSADWDDWLDATIRAAGDLLDVVTHHIYPSNGWASEVTYDLETGGPFPFSPPSVQEVLQRSGWWQRPFWLTESGVESARWGEGRQASFVDDLLDQWFSPTRDYRNWVDRLFFYEMTDAGNPPSTTWGLLRGPPEFDPKPAYTAYSEFIANSEVDDAELVDSDIPVYYDFGESVSAEITLRNTGTTEWSTVNLSRLEAGVSTYGWNITVEQLGPDEIVAPGEIHTFSVVVASPTILLEEIGRNPSLYARMERVGAWPFGEPLRQEMVVAFSQAPSITRQPVPSLLLPGASTRLSVTADGSEPLSYQWLRNGAAVVDGELFSGADTASLTVTALSSEVEGFYQCVVSNSVGAVVSQTSTVTIGQTAPRNGGSRVSPDRPVEPNPLPVDQIRYTGPTDRR
jgi:hypothetical protein